MLGKSLLALRLRRIYSNSSSRNKNYIINNNSNNNKNNNNSSNNNSNNNNNNRINNDIDNQRNGHIQVLPFTLKQMLLQYSFENHNVESSFVSYSSQEKDLKLKQANMNSNNISNIDINLTTTSITNNRTTTSITNNRATTTTTNTNDIRNNIS
ncbi:hypothetical protein PoB_003484900 [Plakobranchus ocellatus]|uniref:Uncharacterized protein n=1 Tax=Plakobranchus ocellatus TaxID=259542 RepID=A0AAV4AKT8_9GAST|nr:hypothetical protein PoB_003484900 [Plakobranchus ocellatus]